MAAGDGGRTRIGARAFIFQLQWEVPGGGVGLSEVQSDFDDIARDEYGGT